MTVQHVFSGPGAPTEAPSSVGAHYIDTESKAIYLAVGTDDVLDWVMLATKAEMVVLSDRVSALEPPVPMLLLEVEFTSESWWFGDYPAIVSVEGMVGGAVESNLDLSLFTKAGDVGADVSYNSGSGTVQIGYSDRYTAINTGVPVSEAGWTRLRIGLSGIGSFDGVANVLNALDPREEIGSQTFLRGESVVYVEFDI